MKTSTKEGIEARGFKVLTYIDTDLGNVKNFLGVDRRRFKKTGEESIDRLQAYLKEIIISGEELNMFKFLSAAFEDTDLTEEELRSILILVGKMSTDNGENLFSNIALKKDSDSEFFRNMLKKTFVAVMNDLIK